MEPYETSKLKDRNYKTPEIHKLNFNADRWDWSNRWPDFSINEIACRDYTLAINPYSMDALQLLRNTLRKPLIINSAYRSPEYNKQVGGAKNSQHMRGKAFDISMVNHDVELFMEIVENLIDPETNKPYFNGIGYYEKYNMVHIDTRDKKARWGKRWSNEGKYNHQYNIEVFENVGGSLSVVVDSIYNFKNQTDHTTLQDDRWGGVTVTKEVTYTGLPEQPSIIQRIYHKLLG